MSENTIPERADVRQLRIQAKELLQELKTQDPAAKLAQAQRQIAQRYGYSSWPKLVQEVELPILIGRFKRAIYEGDAEKLEKLFRAKPVLRAHLDDPMFDFDSTALIQASRHPNAAKLLPLLVRHGADPNARSKWWAGEYGPLDMVSEPVAELLVGLGSRWDVWSAAAHGRLEILRELLDADPSLVNAPGGDGERPLHFALTAEVAELLIERGADLEQKDVDHEGTPLQYQVTNPAVRKVLLARGAVPDIFTAVVEDDAELVARLLREDPSRGNARIGSPPFSTENSNGGHIYAYRFGPNKTPQVVAAESGKLAALKALEPSTSDSRRLIAAAWRGDEETVRQLRGGPIEEAEAGAVSSAAQSGRAETVRLLLEAGFDPTVPGMDSGTALHVACWFGYAEVVALLIGRVPLDALDAHHGSPPLGWACHGAEHCRNPKGDYVAVIEALIEAGASVSAPANSGGTAMMDQAGTREDVKEVLRRHGG